MIDITSSLSTNAILLFFYVSTFIISSTRLYKNLRHDYHTDTTAIALYGSISVAAGLWIVLLGGVVYMSLDQPARVQTFHQFSIPQIIRTISAFLVMNVYLLIVKKWAEIIVSVSGDLRNHYRLFNCEQTMQHAAGLLYLLQIICVIVQHFKLLTNYDRWLRLSTSIGLLLVSCIALVLIPVHGTRMRALVVTISTDVQRRRSNILKLMATSIFFFVVQAMIQFYFCWATLMFPFPADGDVQNFPDENLQVMRAWNVVILDLQALSEWTFTTLLLGILPSHPVPSFKGYQEIS